MLPVDPSLQGVADQYLANPTPNFSAVVPPPPAFVPPTPAPLLPPGQDPELTKQANAYLATPGAMSGPSTLNPGFAPPLAPDTSGGTPPGGAAGITATQPWSGPTVEHPVGGAGGGGAGTPGVNPDAAILASGQRISDAIRAGGEATAKSDAAEAEARRQGAEQIAAQQKDLQAQRVQRDQFFRQVNQESADALEKAHNATVPDFWEGKEGQMVTAAILVGLGAVAQGLTAFGTGVNIGNGAQQTINHAVDSYYDRKKDEINNLYKYAAAKGQLDEQKKLDYATKLNDLQFDIAATHQSIQDHLAEVAAQGRGAIDQSHFAQLAAENEQRTQGLQQAAAMGRAQIVRMKAETSIGYGNLAIARENADSERIKALGAGQKATDTEGKTAVFAPDKNPDGSQRLLGYVTSGRGGAQKFSEADAAFTNAISAARAFDADIAQNGERVVTPEAVKRREYLKKNANIAIGAVSSLGNTDSAHDQEFASIGSSGAGFSLYGANREAVQAKIAELAARQERARTQGLIERPGAWAIQHGAQNAAAPSDAPPPLGTKATSGGKPIVMTATGWSFVQ